MQFLNQAYTWFCPLSWYVCACVSTTEAINYIHVIVNLHIKLSKFATSQNLTKRFCPWEWITNEACYMSNKTSVMKVGVAYAY